MPAYDNTDPGSLAENSKGSAISAENNRLIYRLEITQTLVFQLKMIKALIQLKRTD